MEPRAVYTTNIIVNTNNTTKNYNPTKLNDTSHDKTNKIACAPALSSLCAEWVAKDPSFLHADSEDTDQTGRMDAHSDLSLRWAHSHFVGFVMRRLKILYITKMYRKRIIKITLSLCKIELV